MPTGVNFLVWDVGGQEKLRPLWKSYTRCTDGIIFVVDSCDTERLEEAKMEITRVARSPDNAGVPILILANKQDLPGTKLKKKKKKNTYILYITPVAKLVHITLKKKFHIPFI